MNKTRKNKKKTHIAKTSKGNESHKEKSSNIDKIIIDDKYTYQLQGYGGYLIGWLDIPVVELTESGDVLVMKYKKPPGYFITTDTINPNSIQYIKSNLGKNEIEPPIKEGKPKIRLVKK